ncbi:MAG TPA: class I SAM-dependent methyltransferase [Gaiellaceae bacterium]|nr:class I SAM-dependent methyltransferase [Gaiellaceae bacterium]
MGQYHFTPERYLESVQAEVPDYETLQERTAAAVGTAGEILELGVGTGETARRVLERHPGARLVGIDESPPMLEQARLSLPASADLRVGRLQDALPAGPFDAVVSALAVHHLTAAEKRDLFARVLAVLRPGGVFVLADVVVPDDSADVVTPIEEGYDLPDRLDDQLGWLREAGFEPEVVWAARDVAVVRATRP